MLAALAGAAVTLLILPPAEYLAHRLVMHHPTPLGMGAFVEHHVEHHRKGRVDLNIDLPAWLMAVTPARCGWRSWRSAGRRPSPAWRSYRCTASCGPASTGRSTAWAGGGPNASRFTTG